MLFKRKKKTEQTDELHHEYGLISNCGYIIRAFLRYQKSTVAFLLLGGIAGASMSYIWTVIAKLVIDMITQQAGTSGHDITPLLWLGGRRHYGGGIRHDVAEHTFRKEAAHRLPCNEELPRAGAYRKNNDHAVRTA